MLRVAVPFPVLEYQKRTRNSNQKIEPHAKAGLIFALVDEMKLKRFPYSRLNGRQKENHNFQKVSSVLAEYGYSTIRLSDDWNGADFIALHADGVTVLRVQLKSRIYFKKEYVGKQLWLCFPERKGIYFFPHDDVLKMILKQKRIMRGTNSWEKKRAYSIKDVPKWMEPLLSKYYLTLSD